MKLVPRNDTEKSAYVNTMLNAPTVQDLVAETEALIYELEKRMLKSVEDHKALSAARDKALAAQRRVPFP
jgi:Tfp pilus assembly ATPase PilU